MIGYLILFSVFIGGIYLIIIQELRLENIRGGDEEAYKKAIDTPREAFFITVIVFILGLLLMFLFHCYEAGINENNLTHFYFS